MTTPGYKPRVLIADDHELIARALSAILQPSCEIVGIARTGRDAVRQAMLTPPHVAILDISMPEMNGIQAAMELTRILPRIKIIFVTQQVDAFYLRAAVRVGAVGFVSKQSASDEILKAFQTVIAGGTFISPALNPQIVFPHRGQSGLNETVFTDPLTSRQREVLQLVAEGRTAKEISTLLSISVKTVEFHKNALMNELGVRTTAELTRYALMHGIIT